MNRRGFISVLAGGVAFSSGCLVKQQQEQDIEIHSLGESVTADGLKITPIEYDIIGRKFAEKSGISNESGHEAFLLVMIELECVGDEPVSPPDQGPRGKGDVHLIYKGKQMYGEFKGQDLTIDNFTYKELGDTGGKKIKPGEKIQRWAMFEIPKGFDRTKTFLKIELRNNGKLKSYNWKMG